MTSHAFIKLLPNPRVPLSNSRDLETIRSPALRTRARVSSCVPCSARSAWRRFNADGDNTQDQRDPHDLEVGQPMSGKVTCLFMTDLPLPGFFPKPNIYDTRPRATFATERFPKDLSSGSQPTAIFSILSRCEFGCDLSNFLQTDQAVALSRAVRDLDRRLFG